MSARTNTHLMERSVVLKPVPKIYASPHLSPYPQDLRGLKKILSTTTTECTLVLTVVIIGFFLLAVARLLTVTMFSMLYLADSNISWKRGGPGEGTSTFDIACIIVLTRQHHRSLTVVRR